MSDVWFGNPDGLTERQESVYALLCLYFDDRPLKAREIAEATGIAYAQGLESRKRRVREAVAVLREKGAPICANLDDGYWLARSATEFRAWRDAESKKAKFKFAELKRVAGAVADGASGQGRLFGGGDSVDVFRR